MATTAKERQDFLVSNESREGWFSSTPAIIEKKPQGPGPGTRLNPAQSTIFPRRVYSTEATW